jgi:Na+-transporting methylmalonyl-CoA/oxaloacetate decarboxylase gamma subunit
MYLSIILQNVHKGADDIAILDPTGAGMAIVSVSIVFVALTSLYLIFRSIGKLFQRDFRFKSRKHQNENRNVQHQNEDEPTGEVCAAIAMAMYYYNSQNHDYENTILTIKKNTSNYSPWSSKIYGLRKNL